MANQKYKVITPPNILTEELAYWLGFILTDGNLRRQGKRSWQLRFNINQGDREHLQRFLSFLQSDYPIYEYRATNSCAVTITSETLGELVLSYGITPRKSKTVMVDPRLAVNRHFWRGVLDGDGWLSKDGYRFSIAGTYDVCSKFSKFMSLGLEPKARGDNFYVLETCGKKVRIVAKTLYDGATIALPRKALLAGRV